MEHRPAYGAPDQAYGQTPTGYQPGPPSPTSQFPAGGYGYGYSQPPYASWLTRVGAYLVDALPVWVLLAIGGALAGHGGAGAGIGIIFYLAALGWIGYNRWYRAGTTGQSLGKSATNVRLSNEQTGAPIGAGLAFLRDLAHFVDAIICYVGFLFPLWDGKRQTLADKIVGTVVVRNGAVPPPGYQQHAALRLRLPPVAVTAAAPGSAPGALGPGSAAQGPALPPRYRRLAGPASGAVLAGAATGFLYLVNPHAHQVFLPCPFRLITGLYCPFCGGLRMVHDLAHGQVVAALHDDALALPLLAIAVLAWLNVAVSGWRGRASGPGAAARLAVARRGGGAGHLDRPA